MTEEEFKSLSDKVSSGEASPAEKLSLLKEINYNIEAMKSDLASLKASQEASDNI